MIDLSLTFKIATLLRNPNVEKTHFANLLSRSAAANAAVVMSEWTSNRYRRLLLFV
jgi:hypothetical protein